MTHKHLTYKQYTRLTDCIFILSVGLIMFEYVLFSINWLDFAVYVTAIIMAATLIPTSVILNRSKYTNELICNINNVNLKDVCPICKEELKK